MECISVVKTTYNTRVLYQKNQNIAPNFISPANESKATTSMEVSISTMKTSNQTASIQQTKATPPPHLSPKPKVETDKSSSNASQGELLYANTLFAEDEIVKVYNTRINRNEEAKIIGHQGGNMYAVLIGSKVEQRQAKFITKK